VKKLDLFLSHRYNLVKSNNLLNAVPGISTVIPLDIKEAAEYIEKQVQMIKERRRGGSVAGVKPTAPSGANQDIEFKLVEDIERQVRAIMDHRGQGNVIDAKKFQLLFAWLCLIPVAFDSHQLTPKYPQRYLSCLFQALRLMYEVKSTIPNMPEAKLEINKSVYTIVRLLPRFLPNGISDVRKDDLKILLKFLSEAYETMFEAYNTMIHEEQPNASPVPNGGEKIDSTPGSPKVAPTDNDTPGTAAHSQKTRSATPHGQDHASQSYTAQNDTPVIASIGIEPISSEVSRSREALIPTVDNAIGAISAPQTRSVATLERDHESQSYTAQNNSPVSDSIEFERTGSEATFIDQIYFDQDGVVAPIGMPEKSKIIKTIERQSQNFYSEPTQEPNNLFNNQEIQKAMKDSMVEAKATTSAFVHAADTGLNNQKVVNCILFGNPPVRLRLNIKYNNGDGGTLYYYPESDRLTLLQNDKEVDVKKEDFPNILFSKPIMQPAIGVDVTKVDHALSSKSVGDSTSTQTSDYGSSADVSHTVSTTSHIDPSSYRRSNVIAHYTAGASSEAINRVRELSKTSSRSGTRSPILSGRKPARTFERTLVN